MKNQRTKSIKNMLLFSIAISFVIAVFCLCVGFNFQTSIANAEVVNGGAFYLTNGASKTLEGLEKVSGYSASGNGGAYYIESKASVTMNGGMVVGNSASRGGAFYNDNGTLTINGGVIYNNTAEYGGAIFSADGTLIINGGSISSCNSVYGAIYIGSDGGSFKMTGGSIFADGYAIWISYASTTVEFSGGSVIGDIYSKADLKLKSAFKINGTMFLSDDYSKVNLTDYDGTTPRYDIKVNQTRGEGAILKFTGSTTKPDLSRMDISGYNKEKYTPSLTQDSSGNWQVVLEKVVKVTVQNYSGSDIEGTVMGTDSGVYVTYMKLGETINLTYNSTGVFFESGWSKGKIWNGETISNDSYTITQADIDSGEIFIMRKYYWQVEVFTVTDGNLRDATGGKVYAYPGQTGMTDDYRQNGTAVQPGFGNGQKWTGPVAEVNDGYVFRGWYDNAECSGTPVSTELSFSIITDNNKASYVYYAKFDRVYYKRVDSDGTPNPKGNYVLFGSYPKTIKASDIDVDETNVDENGYFLGSDGERYAKIQANPYSSNQTFSDGTTIVEGEYYYFKVEPIIWKIMTIENGQAVLFAVNIIDAQVYYENCGENRTIDGKTIYSNNYEYSDIRAWLNDTFYNNAFSSNENNTMIKTTVDNTTTTSASSNSYASEDTEDNVWLPSYKDLTNSSNYSSDPETFDSRRQKQITDFAITKNMYYYENPYAYGKKCGGYHSRSPSSYGSSMIIQVAPIGRVSDQLLDENNYGVAPMIVIKL